MAGGFITVQAERLAVVQRKLDGLPKAARDTIADGIEQGTKELEREIKQNLSGDAERGDPVQVRSGRLRASVASYTDRKELKGVVGSPVEYAAMVEFGTVGLPGGVLVPRDAKVLAIPLPAALTAAGKSRGGPRDFEGKYDETFWARSKKGNLIFFGLDHLKKGDRLTALFVGKTEVTIEGRAPFGQAAETAEPAILKHIDDAIFRILPGDAQ